MERLAREEQDLETAYRQALDKNAEDVTSAVGLGELLAQKGQFEEAERWLTKALQHREKLVDDGRFVELELLMVRRKLANQRSPRL